MLTQSTENVQLSEPFDDLEIFVFCYVVRMK